MLLILASTLFAMAHKPTPSEQKIDDWEYNATVTNGGKSGRALSMAAPMLAPASKMVMSESIGLTVGGARDVNNFYENIKQGYLPKIGSITYEGVFAEHYFLPGEKSPCEALFCPILSTAVTKNLFSEKAEYYLNVGLDSGIKASDFTRKKLNIVIVLDISGSMSAPFDAYYYDNGKKIPLSEEERKKSKMEIANRSIVAMMAHLKPEDRLGIALFDNNAYIAKPLRPVALTDMEAIKKHILSLRPRGGTNWSAGYRKGLSLFEKLSDALKDPSEYENRIIFLTDAMPNTGELSEEGLFGMVKSASQKGIYTSFVGIGVDFNNDLVKAVSKTKGANYFSVHSAKAFKERMEKEFDYWVTPLVFDLKLELIKGDFDIEAVYGAPEADRESGTLLHLGTLFPSETKEERIKGGLILAKLQKRGDGDEVTLRLSYTDRDGRSHSVIKKANFKPCCYYDNSGIRKGIWLARYVTLMQNWLIDMRRGCNDIVKPLPPLRPLKKRAFLYPPERPEFSYMPTWERRSCPLIVSRGYRDLFTLFAKKFAKEMRTLKDESLKKELDTLNDLSRYKKGSHKGKRDDWREPAR